MAKRSRSAAEAVQLTPDTFDAPQLPDVTPPQRPEIVQPQAPESPQLSAEPPAAEPSVRQWRANPYPLKMVNLEGYKVQLQESRPQKERAGTEDDPSRPRHKARWEIQIKLGSGTQVEMPSADIRDYIKSHKLDVVNREGEVKQVQLFKWNDQDRAWGMEIDYNTPRASREKAYAVYDEVVKRVAEERGVGRAR